MTALVLPGWKCQDCGHFEYAAFDDCPECGRSNIQYVEEVGA